MNCCLSLLALITHSWYSLSWKAFWSYPPTDYQNQQQTFGSYNERATPNSLQSWLSLYSIQPNSLTTAGLTIRPPPVDIWSSWQQHNTLSGLLSQSCRITDKQFTKASGFVLKNVSFQHSSIVNTQSMYDYRQAPPTEQVHITEQELQQPKNKSNKQFKETGNIDLKDHLWRRQFRLDVLVLQTFPRSLASTVPRDTNEDSVSAINKLLIELTQEKNWKHIGYRITAHIGW